MLNCQLAICTAYSKLYHDGIGQVVLLLVLQIVENFGFPDCSVQAATGQICKVTVE